METGKETTEVTAHHAFDTMEPNTLPVGLSWVNGSGDDGDDKGVLLCGTFSDGEERSEVVDEDTVDSVSVLPISLFNDLRPVERDFLPVLLRYSVPGVSLYSSNDR